MVDGKWTSTDILIVMTQRFSLASVVGKGSLILIHILVMLGGEAGGTHYLSKAEQYVLVSTIAGA